MELQVLIMLLLGIIFVIIILIYLWINSFFSVPPTGEINNNIKTIKNSLVSSYIYTKNSDIILIDAGFNKTGMIKGLKTFQIEPEKVSDVFITHADPDHTGALSLFENAKIYFGKETKIDNHENLDFIGDNEVINVGEIKVEAISTPGHRLGHTAYLIDEKYLFTGDLLRLKKGKVKPFIKLISSNFEDLLHSIKKISKLKNIEMILTAHTGYISEFDRAMDNWS